MKGNLHCVESHEAESALFFGGLKKLMNFALEVQKKRKKKKLMPSIWKEDGERKAMKENLHCVESHEAESALFFGSLESGGLQGPAYRFRIWGATYLFVRKGI